MFPNVLYHDSGGDSKMKALCVGAGDDITPMAAADPTSQTEIRSPGSTTAG